MATEEDAVQERLDRILIRVKSGLSLSDALKAEKSFHWFYKKLLDHRLRLPIIAASREVQQRKRQAAKMAGGTKVDSTQTSMILLEIPTTLKQNFQVACDQRGVTMNRQLCSLVSGDIARFKAGI